MKSFLQQSTGGGTDVASSSDDQAIISAREDALDRVLFGSVIVAGIGVFLHITSFDYFGAAFLGAMVAFLYWLRSGSNWSLKSRSFALLGTLYLTALQSLLRMGLTGSGALFLAVMPPLALLLVSIQAGFVMATVSVATWIGTGIFLGAAGVVIPVPDTWRFMDWALHGLDLLWVIVILVQLQQQFREAQDFVVSVAQQKQDLLETRAELTKLTKQLDYERKLLHTLLDTVSDKIFFKDLSGRYTRISQAVAQQFDIQPQLVLGKTDFDFYAVDYAQEIQAKERQIMETGHPLMDRVEREIWRDGRPDTWSINSRLPLKGEDGKVIGWFGTARDITEIKKAQEADQRHAQQLAIVAEVGRAVTSSLDIDNLLRVLVELVQQSFAYYGVNVWLRIEQGETVRLNAGFSPEGSDLGKMDIQVSLEDDNSIVRVCKRGEFELVDVLPEMDWPLRGMFPAVQSQLILPLRIAEKTLGALEILNKQAGAFREEDVTLLRSLADQVTIAIRNASLYQAEQARRHFVERIYEVTRALSSTLKLAPVLSLILKQLDEIVSADRLALMLFEKDGLEVVASRGFPDQGFASRLRVTVQPGDVYDQIQSTRQPLAISDVAQRSDWKQADGIPEAHSWLGIPLISSDQVIGMLSLTREEYRPYSLGEITLAQTFAGQAALALENARLYDNLERFNQQLEQMVMERTEELRRAYDLLERLDRTKSNFISVTSHELRTPITVLKGYSQMLLQNQVIESDPAMASMVNGIYTGAVRMHEIVNSMLDIAKIDSKSLQLSTEPLALILLLKRVVGNIEQALRQRNLSLELVGLDELPSVEADADALQKVFMQLLVNAIKYTPDGGKITISGKVVTPGDDWPDGGVEIVVSDTGIGIDPGYHELIFTKFFQTGEVALHSSGKTKFKGGGPGLGLPIARGIVEAHQGKLWVESSGYDEKLLPGSRFHVILPARQRSDSAAAA